MTLTPMTAFGYMRNDRWSRNHPQTDVIHSAADDNTNTRTTGYIVLLERLCGPVVGVPGYRCRGPGFDSQRYQIFWKVVGLERGPLRLVSTIEKLFGRNSSSSGLKNREYGRGDPLGWPRDALYPQKLALTYPTGGGRSVGIVRLQTKTTEFICCFFVYSRHYATAAR
jgi:hypothetical protein